MAGEPRQRLTDAPDSARSGNVQHGSLVPGAKLDTRAHYRPAVRPLDARSDYRLVGPRLPLGHSYRIRRLLARQALLGSGEGRAGGGEQIASSC